jgi:hypothetical protein
MIQSKACFEAAIQSERKEIEREQRSRMSVGKCQVEERRERGSRKAECIQQEAYSKATIQSEVKGHSVWTSSSK